MKEFLTCSLVASGLFFLLLFTASYVLPQSLSETDVIERVEIFGNNTTRSEILMREINAQSGANFSLQQIEEDKSRLMATGVLNAVEAQIKPAALPNRWIIVYIVREKLAWIPQPKFFSNRLQGHNFGLSVKLDFFGL